VFYTIAPKDLNKFLYLPAGRMLPSAFYDREVKIFIHPEALPRAFIVHQAIFEPDEKRSFDKIRSIRDSFGKIAVIQHEPIDEMVKSLKASSLEDDSVAYIVKYTPNEVVIEADMKHDGLLVFGDGYHPGWKAYADGKEIEVFITDYLIRSVFLSQGNHTVRFRFEPVEFYQGRIVSGISLIILALLLIAARSRWMKKRLTVGGDVVQTRT
jgi:hypothetical protein